MNNDFTMGRVCAFIYYLIGALIIVVTGLIYGRVGTVQQVVIDIYMVLTLVSFISLNGHISELAYEIVQMISFLALAVFFFSEFESLVLFFIVLAMQGVIASIFIDKRMMKIQAGSMTVFMLAFGIKHFWMSDDTGRMFEYLTGAVSVMGIQQICSSLVSIIQHRDRISLVQELSLNDLLKVLEFKRDEAQAATKSKSDFLSNMSHEIRTPLNSVLGMNEMILRESKDDNVIEYAQNVERSGRMLLALINDVLDLSKIESGKMEIIPVNYQISSLINDTVTMLYQRVEDKGLKLVVKIDPTLPNYLYGDEVRIQQVLTNILTNAIKYTDAGTITVNVGFREKGEKQIALIMSVADTGRGIKKEDMDHLFSAFQRVDEKKNRNIEGTGLGLTITARFVEMMKGHITVDSEYGRGSLFTIEIPQKITKEGTVGTIDTEAGKRQKKERHKGGSFTAPEARVLVVDDNKMNLRVATGLLKPTLVQTDTVMSGQECIEKLQNETYHIVLLDYMMPEMDGVETLNKIREMKLAEGVPFIALTANAVSGAKEFYIENGFTDYLTKPINVDEMEEMLCRLLPKELVTKAQ